MQGATNIIQKSHNDMHRALFSHARQRNISAAYRAMIIAIRILNITIPDALMNFCSGLAIILLGILSAFACMENGKLDITVALFMLPIGVGTMLSKEGK